MKITITCIWILCLLAPVASVAAAASDISSPDGRILLRTHAASGQVAYSVEFNGKPVIAKSRLGIELGGGHFSGAIMVSGSKTRSHDDTWEPVWGQFSEVRDHYNELTLGLTEIDAPTRRMQVILRAYNDGIAFRYAFPKQQGLQDVTFEKELSSVAIVSENPIAWYAKSSTGLSSHVPFEQINRACRTPFTVQLSGNCFISLHEAAVVNSSDATLSLAEDKRTLTYSSGCRQETGTVSAWRSIQIASAPGGLIESSLLLNLNEPHKMADTSWIKPGVSLWDWRCHGGKADDGFVYGINTESYIRYIDFAHEHGLAYVLIDAEWYGPERDAKSDPVTHEHEVDMPKITRYAKEKGVGIWVYLNDIALKNFDMDRTFAQYQKWGIKGIKHGFLGGGSQAKIEFSVKVLETCAQYQIMYNLHEPMKPTGVTRRFPHYMSREYVNSMLDAPTRPPATPTELCIFPVVHNLAGPVDRSCGLFDMDESILRAKVHKQIPSTVVSQAAQCLVFPSGILTLPDMPDAYKRKLDLFEFIKQLPMTYDETEVLEMTIGEYITMARRAGDTWRVAALANESGRELALKLDFLEPGVTYDVTLYEDTAESDYRFSGPWSRREAARQKVPFTPVETYRERYQIRQTTVKQGDTISARIAPGGGHCMWLRPANTPATELAKPKIFNIKDYGAIGDGVAMNTDAVQKTIDACHVAGGGSVRVPAGDYVIGTIRLTSNVTLSLDYGASLLGSTNLADYPTEGLDDPREGGPHCLIYAKDATDITIEGLGTIDGRGTHVNFPRKRTGGRNTGIRPRLLRMDNCENLTFSGITYKRPAFWGLHLIDCKDIHFNGITVRFRNNNYNNDGLDLDGCENVLIENCDIESGDDAICLKSSKNPCRNIVVRACRVASNTSPLKFGTSSRGGFLDVSVTNCYFYDSPMGAIKLQLVDGGRLENVDISRIVMENVGNPIFIRLGDRGNTYSRERGGKIPVGTVKNIRITDVVAKVTVENRAKAAEAAYKNVKIDTSPGVTDREKSKAGPIMITGIPGHCIEDVVLENIKISYPGHGNEEDAERVVPEDGARYPEQFFFGVLPAWGAYIRHARNVEFKNVALTLRGLDARQRVVLDDVEGFVEQ